MNYGRRAIQFLKQSLPAMALLVVCLALACAGAERPAAESPAPTATPVPTAAPTLAAATESLIRLVDPLDEPEFYCVDVVGHRDGVRLDRALHAHTCKPGFEDELFMFDTPSDGQLYMAAYDLCLEAREGEVYLESCSDSPGQRFEHGADGALRAEGGAGCLAVASGAGQPAGGPSHVRRDLLLAPCDSVEPALSRWVFPGPSP